MKLMLFVFKLTEKKLNGNTFKDQFLKFYCTISFLQEKMT